MCLVLNERLGYLRKNSPEDATYRVFSQRKETIFWSSELLLPSRVVLSTGRVNSLSGPASAFGGLLFSEKGCNIFSYTCHKRLSLKPQH